MSSAPSVVSAPSSASSVAPSRIVLPSFSFHSRLALSTATHEEDEISYPLDPLFPPSEPSAASSQPGATSQKTEFDAADASLSAAAASSEVTARIVRFRSYSPLSSSRLVHERVEPPNFLLSQGWLDQELEFLIRSAVETDKDKDSGKDKDKSDVLLNVKAKDPNWDLKRDLERPLREWRKRTSKEMRNIIKQKIKNEKRRKRESQQQTGTGMDNGDQVSSSDSDSDSDSSEQNAEPNQTKSNR